MNGTRRRHDSVQFAETAARNHPAVTLRRPERPTRPGQRLQSPQLTENTGVDAGLQLRIEARLPLPRHLQLERAAVRRHCLAAIAVAAVARPGLAYKVMVH